MGTSQGKVVSLHITPAASEPVATLDEVRARAGRGLEGDRYFFNTGTYSERPQPERQITLIESEVLQSLAEVEGIPFSGQEARRNVVTEGVRLVELIGHRFRVGEVLLEGVRICQPCAYLEELTGKAVLKPLVDRGGLNAVILASGVIRTGDLIQKGEE